MRSISTALLGFTLVLSGTGLTTACTHSGGDGGSRTPRIASEGSRARDYTTLAELARSASAVVIAEPAGMEFDKPVPRGYGPADEAPIPYVQMRVTRVLSGSMAPGLVDVVSPGIDEHTGRQAIGRGGPYLLFITPAMYGADDPAGGYAVVGGPAGVYAAKDKSARSYLRVDVESPKLPAEIVDGRTSIPPVSKSEAQLLHDGPQ